MQWETHSRGASGDALGLHLRAEAFKNPPNSHAGTACKTTKFPIQLRQQMFCIILCILKIFPQNWSDS